MTDPGLSLVDAVARQLALDESRLVREPRGFIWWGGGLAQRIWADLPVEGDGTTTTRVSIRTDLLRGFQSRPENFDELTVSLDDLALCAMMRGDASRQQLQLVSALFVTAAALEWQKRLAGLTASLQAGSAHRIAAELALLVGASPDLSTPVAGQAVGDDEELLGIEETVVRPLGGDASRWDHAQLEAVTERVLSKGAGIAVDEHDGLFTAKFPFGDEGEGEPALLVIDPTRPHPFLGSGLWIWLLLPPEGPVEPTAEITLALNGAEQSSSTGAHFVGSWCEHRGQLAHAIFLPNAIHEPQLLEALIYSQAVRARWAELFLESAFED